MIQLNTMVQPTDSNRGMFQESLVKCAEEFPAVETNPTSILLYEQTLQGGNNFDYALMKAY